jgi:hypothetical protein
MTKASSKQAIIPDRMYRITFSKAFEYDGEKYIPRDDVRHKVSGAVLELIKENLDEYEAV